MSDNNSSMSLTGELTASISVSSSSIPSHNSVSGVIGSTNHLVGALGATDGGAGNSVSGVVSPTNHLVGTFGTASGGGSGGGDKHFVYTQRTPSDRWVVNHGLDKYPSVTVVDSAESIVVGNCEYIDKNIVILTFNGSFSGKAYFN